MNAKARTLGDQYPLCGNRTGLSIHQRVDGARSTKLLIATEQYPLIGQLSTTTERMASFKDLNYTLPFRNTTIWCITRNGTSS